jgi:hypothetical protein
MKKGMVRVAVYPIDAVLPFIFTREVRFALKTAGFDYNSNEWKAAGSRMFPIQTKKGVRMVRVSMGSHRYELFATKGITCVKCGVVGSFFALERGKKNNPKKFHFNLYGFDENGREVLITKDHIQPRAKGGKNKLSNYQPMCQPCNQKKGDKLL